MKKQDGYYWVKVSKSESIGYPNLVSLVIGYVSDRPLLATIVCYGVPFVTIGAIAMSVA
jgi:hypothetical protein